MRTTFIVILVFAANAYWAIVACGQTINVKTADSLQALSQKWANAYKSTHPAGDVRVSADSLAGVFAALADRGGAFERAPFASPVADFYLTNPIARASRVMAECSALRARGSSLQAAE